jgi:uncharacterized protein
MNEEKKTLVIGANTDPAKYAYKAIKRLRASGHPVIGFGIEEGTVDDVEIETSWNAAWKPDTVTLYVNPRKLEAYRQPILDLHPKRVIFNPGTEHAEFIRELRQNGIVAEVACTLVLLSIGQY